MPSRWDVFWRGQAVADLVAYGQYRNEDIGEDRKSAAFDLAYQSATQLQSSVRESEEERATIKTEPKTSPKALATKTGQTASAAAPTIKSSPKKAAKKTTKTTKTSSKKPTNGVSKPKSKPAPKTQAVKVDPALVDSALAQVAESPSGGSASDSAPVSGSGPSPPPKQAKTRPPRPPPEPSLREQLKTKGLWFKALQPTNERLYCSKCRSYANKSKFKTVERMASHLDTKHRTFRLTIFCDYSECPRSVCGFACNKEKYEHQKRFHQIPENSVADV